MHYGCLYGQSSFPKSELMIIVGMPMESLFTVIGQKWAGYFLSFCLSSCYLIAGVADSGPGIVVNVSGSFQSFELMPSFYRYGAGFPFFNSVSTKITVPLW